ncbi:cupin domain-containing protein [Rhizobium sp. BR 315]|uniref:cupin domain-containing protein n=1 Tax=Rhizobium sp. BR 315 TaxID=3040014 RepID=UPI003D32C512
MSPHRDVLSLLAPMLRVRPELQDFCRFGGDWSSPHQSEAKGWAAFHILTKGACSVERKGQPTVRLEAGDVLLLPHGDAHVARGGDGRSPQQIIGTTQKNAIRVKETEGAEFETELICGRLYLESATDDLLLRLLPHTIVLRLSGQQACSRLVETIRDELDADRAGAAAIARDLASALFVMLLRVHLEAEPPADGLLALLGHRETAKAALAMLGDPAREWSLDELAAIAAVSRATLVRAFRRICGMPPLAFLTEVRLSIARNRITHTADALGEIAADVGYQSEAALSRALQRHFAIRPGALRRSARVTEPPPV